MSTQSPSRPILLWSSAAVAVLFGLATLRSGGQVLFGPPETRAAAGAIVPFVLWFNFLAGFAYIAGGGALFLRPRWGLWLALGIALATALVFGALGVHVAAGGAYEARTVAAMAFRLLVWAGIALVAWRARS